MDRKCPRCRREFKDVARFCARCGLALESLRGGECTAGRIPHPEALAAPAGFAACANARDLYYSWESASGGPMMGAEAMAVHLFNAGYPLADARFEFVGSDDRGERVFSVEQSVRQLARGTHVRVEINSWEVARPVAALKAILQTAEFLWPG